MGSAARLGNWSRISFTSKKFLGEGVRI